MWVWLSLILLGCLQTPRDGLEKKLHAIHREMQQSLPPEKGDYRIEVDSHADEISVSISAHNQSCQLLLTELLEQAGVSYTNHLPNIQGVCTLHLKNTDLLSAVRAILDSQQASVAWRLHNGERILTISEQHSVAKSIHHRSIADVTAVRSLQLQHQRAAAVAASLFSSGTLSGIFPISSASVKVGSSPENNNLVMCGPSRQVAAGMRMARACDKPAKALELEIVTYSLKPDQQLANQGIRIQLGSDLGSLLYQLTASSNNGILLNSLPVAADSTIDIDGVASVQLQKTSVLERFAARVANGEEIKLSRGIISYIQGSTFQSGLSYLSAQSIFTGAKIALIPLAISDQIIRVDVKSERAAEPSAGTRLAGNVSQATIANKLQIRSGEWVLIGGTHLSSKADDSSSFAFMRKLPILGQLLPQTSTIVLEEIVMSWLRCNIIDDESQSLYIPSFIAPEEVL